MIRLQDKQNVNAPDSDYPYGSIKDKDTTAGTPVNVETYGDIHQFFEKLMDESGVTPNGLPDNDYSGFQLFEAMITLFFGTSTRMAFKRISIGNWNMYLTGGGTAASSKSVAHGITNWKTIVVLGVSIIGDSDISRTPLNSIRAGGANMNPNGGVGSVNSTSIGLFTQLTVDGVTPSIFDDTEYNDNTINRGYIDVLYQTP